MKCTYTSANGRLTFEFEAADAKDLFLQRSIVENHDEETCGVCKCPHIRCEVRRAGEYTYYEMRCQNLECGARLEFGQNKDMKNLFVKRSGHADTNGWFIYNRSDREHDEAPAPAPAPRQQPSAGSKFATPTPAPAQAPGKPPASSTPAAMTLEQKHAHIIKSLAAAVDEAKVESIMAWANRQDFNRQQRDEQAGASAKAMGRIVSGTPF